ncbi:MAG: carboxypeptidase-like regulatory domain-containing protein, partial [Anaerolineae bacterium]|nr:carboxypeptidase-like regulatory domain-containing protein [Anaerolineae bacterium]
MSSEDQKNQIENRITPIATVIGLMTGIFSILQVILPTGVITPTVAAVAVGLILATSLVWSGKWQWQTATITLASMASILLFIQLIVSQPASVIGYTIRADGTPISGLAIVLTNANGIDQRAISDQGGRFEFRSVPDGRYSITTNGRLLYTGEVPTGWQRIFNPSVNAGSLPIDLSIVIVPSPAPLAPTLTSTSSAVISTNIPSITNTPLQTETHTLSPTSTPTLTATLQPSLTTTLTPTSAITIEVSSLRGWQQTGVEVVEGMELQIEVTEGRWTPWPYRTTYSGAGDVSYRCLRENPNGPCPEPMPDEPIGALIGRIGDQTFKVGNQNTIIVEANGQLYMRINDGDAGLDDNTGSLTVNISIIH